MYRLEYFDWWQGEWIVEGYFTTRYHAMKNREYPHCCTEYRAIKIKPIK